MLDVEDLDLVVRDAEPVGQVVVVVRVLLGARVDAEDEQVVARDLGVYCSERDCFTLLPGEAIGRSASLRASSIRRSSSFGSWPSSLSFSLIGYAKRFAVTVSPRSRSSRP
jgi:hypothetical protein